MPDIRAGISVGPPDHPEMLLDWGVWELQLDHCRFAWCLNLSMIRNCYPASGMCHPYSRGKDSGRSEKEAGVQSDLLSSEMDIGKKSFS